MDGWMDALKDWTNRFFSLWLHFSACLLVTETKEDICVRPICICTVFVKQIGSDSRWFTQQPKASVVILKPHFSPLYLSPVFHPVYSHMHPSSPLHWFCRSSALSVLLSLVYLRDTQFVLFKVVFFNHPNLTRCLGPGFSHDLSLTVLSCSLTVEKEREWLNKHVSRLCDCEHTIVFTGQASVPHEQACIELWLATHEKLQRAALRMTLCFE